jgi:ABC-type branched-subunit amino acid transport system substrate-binding protein
MDKGGVMRKNLGRVLGTAAAVALALGTLVPSASAASHGAKAPPSVPGFDGKTIQLGVITPLSGLAAVIGKPLTNGNQVYWQSLNAKGGVGGKYKVQLVQQDSQYMVANALQGYDQIKGNVVAFDQVLGTQIVQAVLQRLKVDGLVAAPATLDSLWVKVPQLVPIGAPYQVESVNGVDYYLKHGGQGKKICAIAQDDQYGAAGLQGLAFAASKLHFKVAVTTRYATGSDVSAQVGQLADAKCDSVVMVSIPTDTVSIVAKMIGRNFTPQVLGLGPSWLAPFATSPDQADFFAKHYWYLGEGPAWGDTSVPGMAKMLTDVQQYSPSQTPDQYFAFGYAQSWAMDQILEQAVKNGDLSHTGILKAVAQVPKLTFQGLIGDYVYGPASRRNPPRDTALSTIVSGKPVGLNLISSFTSPTALQLKF